MRKHQQQQILDILQSLREVQKAGLYADCQDGALGCVDFIDDIMGEGTKTVEFLKEYCELLFRVYNGEADKDVLRKSLRQVENSAQSELKSDKIEVVFFPYKASMWDSLESIYLAAKDDPDCDAYVVPIPGYELNPNGSFGKMYYDGGEYPESIPVTDWQEYDVEARHPDVIFTHYPYDDNASNYTIHSNFYSKRLRDCCSQLVYVPYFVTGTTVADYCAALPGVLYANQVIVQSEEVRQSYIGHYKNYDKQLGWNGQFGKAEDKFIALGSPKHDKLINTKREDCELPDEWRELIGDRKVVLYNTHMFTWIQNGETYFKKLRYVFDEFRKHENVVLWWRPHPNTEVNFRTKCPQLLDEYYKIIDEYKNGGFGIYDDSPDLHRAIAWSDAYYGDETSSLITMYGVTGKPVFFQNFADLLEEEHKINLFNFKIKNNILWGVSLEINGLFSMDLKTMQLKYYRFVSNERAFDNTLYSSISVSENYIILTPFNGKSIVKYSIDENTFEITLINSVGNCKFTESYEYDGNVYVLPHTHNELIKYNIETGRIIQNKKLCSDLDKQGANGERFFFKSGVVEKDLLMAAAKNCNIVAEYNMSSDKYKFYDIGSSNNKYTNMSYDGENYWIFTHKGSIVKWNKKSNAIYEINNFPVGFTNGANYNFRCAVVFEGSVFVFPSQSNMILKINIKTNEIEPFVNLDKRNKSPSFITNRSKYIYAELAGDYIYASSNFEKCLQKINPVTGEFENIPLVLTNNDYNDIMSKSLFNPPVGEMSSSWGNTENQIVTLPFFLERLATEAINKEQISSENIKKYNNNLDGLSGTRIYNHAKSEVSQ